LIQAIANKFLKNNKPLTQKGDEFTAYFHDLIRQENNRNFKEEQFQEGFLQD
jgi:hypothetical protein